MTLKDYYFSTSNRIKTVSKISLAILGLGVLAIISGIIIEIILQSNLFLLISILCVLVIETVSYILMVIFTKRLKASFKLGWIVTEDTEESEPKVLEFENFEHDVYFLKNGDRMIKNYIASETENTVTTYANIALKKGEKVYVNELFDDFTCLVTKNDDEKGLVEMELLEYNE